MVPKELMADSSDTASGSSSCPLKCQKKALARLQSLAVWKALRAALMASNDSLVATMTHTLGAVGRNVETELVWVSGDLMGLNGIQ